MFETEVFDEIFYRDTSGEKYYMIDNGYKVWIIPDKNMKQGYGIYQVSSFRGKLVRNVLPKLKIFGIARKIAKCRVMKLSLTDNVKSIISKYCKEPYQCSVYYGNLDAEQNFKATMQIYNKNKDLFYIKITKSQVVKKAFISEQKALNRLHKAGIDNIPNCVSVDSVGEWTFFVQDTSDIKRKNEFEFKECHWKFLENIYQVSRCTDSYFKSDIYRYIIYLKKQIDISRQLKSYDILSEGIQEVEKWLRKDERIYSFSHGDFTPWNMYCVDNNIYVFDFEYCMNKAIPFMDYFHYICQTGIIVQGMDKNKVLMSYKKNKKRLSKFLNEPNLAFVSYLLFIISFYFMRKDGNYDTDNSQFQFRIELLKSLLKKEV